MSNSGIGNPGFSASSTGAYSSPYNAQSSYAQRSAQAHTTSSHYSHTTSTGDSEAKQARLLAESTRRVQEQAYYMRRAMDQDDLAGTLERASAMLAELGADDHHHSHHHHHHGTTQVPTLPVSTTSSGSSSQLSPRSYYELHMRALDEMPNLEEFILSLGTEEISKRKFSVKDLYEIVQYSPRVVPRLYLQICAGSALIRTKEVPAKVVLEDLVQNVKCVQCPLRGLFLRNYLLQAAKDKLPDVGNEYGTPGPQEATVKDLLDDDLFSDSAATAAATEKEPEGTVVDSYNFVLQNFVEMNKLWCRIQHLPGDRGSREQRRKREKERNELRMMVGTNLVRLSQLEGITPQIYKEVILPKISEQIVTCHDALAQAYLMDCIIQVFPDEFHLYTLEEFLGVCPKLKEKVNVRTILHSMMERLSKYAKGATGSGDEAAHIINFDAFKLFENCISSTCEAKGVSLQPKEVIRMETALLNFSLKCYPGNLQHVNSCLSVCANSLATVQKAGKEKLDGEAVDELEKLLSIPLETLSLRVLELDYYSHLLAFLPWENRKQVATEMLRSVATSGHKLSDADQIEELYAIISPLLRDESTNVPVDLKKKKSLDDSDHLMPGITNTPTRAALPSSHDNDNDPNSVVFKQEQNLVAKLVHLFEHEDTDELFRMFVVARKHLVYGGKHRMKHTFAPLVFAALPLVFRIHEIEYAPPGSKLGSKGKGKEKSSGGGAADDLFGDAVEEEVGVVTEDLLQLTTTETAKEADNLVEMSPGKEKEGEKQVEEAKPSKVDLLLDLEGLGGSEGGGDKLFDDMDEAEEEESESESETSEEESPREPKLFSKQTQISSRKVFVFLQKLVAIITPHCPDLGFKLYLDLAIAASNCALLTSKAEHPPPSAATTADFNSIAYELMTQAFTLYEDEITDSKAQGRAITSMVGTLLACRGFEKEDYQALITKTAQYGAKLLKKPDQCRMVTLCSHLFFVGDEDDTRAYRNPQRVLECLQRSLKIADACSMASPASVNLFIEILDHYVYYFEKENPVITHKFVSGLIALINEHLGVPDSSSMSDAQAHFRQIIRHIKRKKADETTAGRFAPIVC